VIVGRVNVGAGARIGANAVVLEDVPPGALAVGVPAVVVPAGNG
jgi:serine O-acetyltransferase